MKSSSSKWCKRGLWIVPIMALIVPAFALAQEDSPAAGGAQPASQANGSDAAAGASQAADTGSAAAASQSAGKDAASAAQNAGKGAGDSAADAAKDASSDASKAASDSSKPKGDASKTAGDAGRDASDAARDAGRDARGRRDQNRERDAERAKDRNARDRDDDDDRDSVRRERRQTRDDRDDEDDRDGARRSRDDRRYSRDIDDERSSRVGRRGDGRARGRFGLSFSTGGDRLIVSRILPRTIAARVGIRVDDQIVSINGRRIRSQDDWDRWVWADTDDRVTIIVLRDGREVTLYAEPAWFEESVAVYDDDVDVVRDDRGVYLGIEIDESHNDAAIVADVHPNSPADEVGVDVGDRIVRINGRRITSPDHFHEVVSNLEPGSDVELEFGRRETQSVEIHLDSPRSEVRGRRVDDDAVDVNVYEDRDPDVRVRGGPVRPDYRDDDIEIEGEIRTDGGAVRGGIRTDGGRPGPGLFPRLRGRR